MKVKNIIESIVCVDFLNKIDNIIFKLLYEPIDGYCNLKSKDAIDKANEYIEKYENEISEITKDININDFEEITNEKKKEFILKIKEHYFKQSNIWADEVFSNLVENCLLNAYIHKQDKNMLDKIYNRAICAISWLSNIKNFSKEIKNDYLKSFKKDFIDAINSKDESYILNKPNQKTDYSLFLKLYFLIDENEKNFLSLNLKSFENKLTNKDITFLTTLQLKLNSYKRSEIKDEVCLIKSALNNNNFKSEDKKVEFIFELDDDFKNYFSSNKKLDEENKVALIKRRLNILNNSKENYFKKLLA